MLALKCANFHENMTTGILSMLESEEMTNVTIAVEGKRLKAHQMILSISSPYFKLLLQTNPCKHPIIIMEDVKYTVMKDLLHFMYEGHVQIKDEEIQTFVDTAKELQITWLLNYYVDTQCNANAQKPLFTNIPHAQQASSSNTTKVKKLSTIGRKSVQIFKKPKKSTETHLHKHLAIQKSKQIQSLIRNTSIYKDNNKMESTVPVPVRKPYFKVKAILTPKSLNEESTSDRIINPFLVDPLDESDPLALDNNDPVMVKIEPDEFDKDVFNKDQFLQQLSMTHMEEMLSMSKNYQTGKTAIVQFYETPKCTRIVVNNHHHYIRLGTRKYWDTWRCARAARRGINGRIVCPASVLLTIDFHLIERYKHNHVTVPPEIDQSTVVDTKKYNLVDKDYLKTLSSLCDR